MPSLMLSLVFLIMTSNKLTPDSSVDLSTAYISLTSQPRDYFELRIFQSLVVRKMIQRLLKNYIHAGLILVDETIARRPATLVERAFPVSFCPPGNRHGKCGLKMG